MSSEATAAAPAAGWGRVEARSPAKPDTTLTRTRTFGERGAARARGGAGRGGGHCWAACCICACRLAFVCRYLPFPSSKRRFSSSVSVCGRPKGVSGRGAAALPRRVLRGRERPLPERKRKGKTRAARNTCFDSSCVIIRQNTPTQSGAQSGRRPARGKILIREQPPVGSAASAKPCQDQER